MFSEAGVLGDRSKRNRSSCFLEACREGRGSCICDMWMWASSEIVIRNKCNGRGSRGRCSAFDGDQRQSTERSREEFFFTRSDLRGRGLKDQVLEGITDGQFFVCSMKV